MAPKTATKSEGASKAKSSSSGHASYQDMIKEAIVSLKNRNGSSRQALKKYVKANNAHLKDVQDSMFDSLFNRALKNGVEKGVFEQPKGPSGGTKLAKPAAAAAKKDAPKKEAPKKEGEEKKPATKKATTAKKPAAKKAAPKKETAKKDDTKKATAKKAAPKKAAAKKTAAPKEKKADAVVEKPAVLTKTKSGRVAKSTAQKPAAKKAAPKKAATKKATPKKSEPASA